MALITHRVVADPVLNTQAEELRVCIKPLQTTKYELAGHTREGDEKLSQKQRRIYGKRDRGLEDVGT